MPDQEVALCSLSVKALWQLQKPDKRREKNCDCIFAVILAMTSYVALQRLKVAFFLAPVRYLLEFALTPYLQKEWRNPKKPNTRGKKRFVCATVLS